MNRTRLMVLVLMLSLIVCGASAESILPILTSAPTSAPTPTPAPTPVSAPSYGMRANVAADEVTQNAQGGTVVTYRNVSADGFNSFGVYLVQRGFSVTGTETQGEQTAYALTNGQTDFVMFYQVTEQVMTLVYPQGTDYEQPLFPGYQPLSYGEEVFIPNLGKFKSVDFHLNREANMTGMVDKIGNSLYYYDINLNELYGNKGKEKIYTYFGFQFFNITNHDLNFSAKANDVLVMTIHYINDYGTYSYKQYSQAAFKTGISMYVNGYTQLIDGLYMSFPIKSMTEGYKYAIFNLPSGVRESTDGSIYVTIEFAAGDKYVMTLRENGVNYYDTKNT